MKGGYRLGLNLIINFPKPFALYILLPGELYPAEELLPGRDEHTRRQTGCYRDRCVQPEDHQGV